MPVAAQAAMAAIRRNSVSLKGNSHGKHTLSLRPNLLRPRGVDSPREGAGLGRARPPWIREIGPGAWEHDLDPQAVLETDLSRLKELVKRFRVCWEVWPEYIVVEHQKRQIGFVLEICGTHEPGIEHPTPGCEHCQRVFAGLQEISMHIMPREQRPSVYEVQAYDHALRYAPKRRNRADVILALNIRHRTGFERPVDECEVRCLTEMKQRLRELGASEGQWKEQ